MIHIREHIKALITWFVPLVSHTYGLKVDPMAIRRPQTQAEEVDQCWLGSVGGLVSVGRRGSGPGDTQLPSPHQSINSGQLTNITCLKA